LNCSNPIALPLGSTSQARAQADVGDPVDGLQAWLVVFSDLDFAGPPLRNLFPDVLSLATMA
jgi:hypothetical protein